MTEETTPLSEKLKNNYDLGEVCEDFREDIKQALEAFKDEFNFMEMELERPPSGLTVKMLLKKHFGSLADE